MQEKLDNDQISIYEFPQMLKNRVILEHPSALVMVLNAFMKKLYKNEGINSEDEDVLRL